MKTGFEHDHVPLITLPRTVKSGPMLVTVWSFKCRRAPIRLRGTLTADAWTHFETNPNIERISDYPTSVPYMVRRRNGTWKEETHVPMLGVRYRPQKGESQGRIVYVDVMPLEYRKKIRWDAERVLQMKEVYRDRLNAGYSVLTELDLWIEPRLWNMRVILMHLDANVEAEKSEIRRLLSRCRATTIDDVRAAAGFRKPWHVVPTLSDQDPYQRELVEVDKAFTAIMQLAASGEIAFDMSAPISGATVIWMNPQGGR